jgi:hypothetical protein
LALAASAVSVWVHLQIGLDNDHLALLAESKKLLAGTRPHADILDVSPPLIIYLYAVPVLLSQAAGLPLYLALYTLTFALIAAALLLSEMILRSGKATGTTRQLTLGSLALALLGASFIHQPFADREHLMMVLAAPWFVLFSPLVGRNEVSAYWRVAAAALAAVGFAIKPYFYVFYLATLAFQLGTGIRIRELFRQPEHYIVCGFALAYVALVLVFHDAYVREVLPIGWRTYDVLGWSMESKFDIVWRELLLGFATPGLLATLVLLVVAPHHTGASLAYLYLLLLAAIGNFLLNGGWYYTQYPFIAVSLPLAVVAGCGLMVGIAHSPRILIVVTLVLAGGLGYFYVKPALWRAGWDMYVQRTRGHPLSTIEMHPAPAAKIEAYLAARPRFMFLSTSLWATNLLKEGTRRENVGRLNYLWPLPGMLRYQQAEPETYRWLSTWLTNGVAADLERHKPDMVIVDVSTSQRSLPTDFRIVPWLSRSDHFAKAWKSYSLAERIDACTAQIRENCAYELYFRGPYRNEW